METPYLYGQLMQPDFFSESLLENFIVAL